MPREENKRIKYKTMLMASSNYNTVKMNALIKELLIHF